MQRFGTLVLLAWATAVSVGLAIAGPEATEPGRIKTQAVSQGRSFWVYSIDTTSGRVCFLDRQEDGTWQWVDDGAAPDGAGPVGRYELAVFANDKGAHVYVSDTTTSRLWLLDEANRKWLTRGTPAEGGPTAVSGAPAPGRFRAQVAADGQDFWVHTVDTTTGRVWFLDRQEGGVWKWVDYGAPPNAPGPVGRYQLVALANESGARVYVSDTVTGALWLVDRGNLKWLPRGAP